MKKLMYITYNENIFHYNHSGIRNKIYSQCESFKSAFDEIYCVTQMNDWARLFGDGNIIESKPAITRRTYIENVINWIKKYQIKYVYLRHCGCDKLYIDLLKFFSDNMISVVCEIPTYPYDNEKSYCRETLEDSIYRQYIKQYVSYIATSSGVSEIWGIKCIEIFNGIDVTNYSFHEKKQTTALKEIHMVAVAAEFAFWNGFERLLYGMHEYKCHFHDYSFLLTLVGKGGDERVYMELVNKFDLANEVEFISHLDKSGLNELYLCADIGISTLAAYRKGIDCVSPLKTAEYCACGLPIVSAHRDLRFTNDCYFLLNVPNDSSPINMTDIISFYEELNRKNNYRSEIRHYAEQYLTWKNSMESVISYFMGELSEN